MGIKHILFDFDGVLCDSLDVCVEEYGKLRNEHFIDLPMPTKGMRMDEVYSGPLKRSLDKWLNKEASARFFDLHSAAMAARVEDLVTFPGVTEMLAGLPRGSASIISSAHSDAIARILSVDGCLPPAIFSIRGRDERRLSKTEKIVDVLATVAIPAHEAVFVGDLESDFLYCRNVPIRCVLVTYGYHSRSHLKSLADSAFAIVDSIEELKCFIEDNIG